MEKLKCIIINQAAFGSDFHTPLYQEGLGAILFGTVFEG